MNPQHISQMVAALKPALKSTKRAHSILQHYWQDKIALVWTIQDVYRAANEIGVAVAKTEATHMLVSLHRTHNKQYGLRWSDLTDYIKEDVLGRKLTKTELKRFVKSDVITIRKEEVQR